MATSKTTSGASAAVYESKAVYGYVQFPDAPDFKVTLQADKDNKAPVTVAVNFQAYELPRGVQIMVKEPLVEALQNAVTFEVSTDNAGTVTETQVHTYPFVAVEI
jgi:hypothetical protein